VDQHSPDGKWEFKVSCGHGAALKPKDVMKPRMMTMAGPKIIIIP
jgi:hypothetical protein